MAQYQVWTLNNDYSKRQFLEQWRGLRYRVALNAAEECTIDLPPAYDKIPDMDVMQRVRIVREGSIVWGGVLQGEGWEVSEDAPASDSVQWKAQSAVEYLRWRTVPRPAGQDFDSVTDHADDIAKDLVDRHVGPSAAVGRVCSDVAVAADAHACTETTLPIVGGVLLDHLTDLAKGYGFWWRFIPGASGATFTTAYPLWGLDRTKGNGVNDELVFTFDRRNVKRMRYWRELNEHRNYVYVAGQGEGQEQAITERSDATAIAAYLRRESWLQGGNAGDAEEREGLGDAELAKRAVYAAMEVEAQPAVLTPANLGDGCTIYARRYGREFEMQAIITAIEFEVGADGVEMARPELVAGYVGLGGS